MNNIFKPFFVVSYEMIMCAIFYLPRYKIFNIIKSIFLKFRGAVIGNDVVFYPGTWICSGKNLFVGNNVDFALGVIVTTDGGVFIGDRVLIGYRTQILSANHVIPPIGEKIFHAGHVRKKVVIENDVWIGANCIILPGVRIGEGAVVAAGAVVTKNIQPNTVCAGNPARVIKRRLKRITS